MTSFFRVNGLWLFILEMGIIFIVDRGAMGGGMLHDFFTISALSSM